VQLLFDEIRPAAYCVEPQPEGACAFTVVLDQTPDHCVAIVRDTIIPRVEKDLQAFQLTWGLNGYLVAADLRGRDVALQVDLVRCDASGDQDGTLVVSEHLKRIHSPTQKPSQPFDREQPWAAAQFSD